MKRIECQSATHEEELALKCLFITPLDSYVR